MSWLMYVLLYLLAGFVTLTLVLMFDKDAQKFSLDNDEDVKLGLMVMLIWPLGTLWLSVVGAKHLADWLKKDAAK